MTKIKLNTKVCRFKSVALIFSYCCICCKASHEVGLKVLQKSNGFSVFKYDIRVVVIKDEGDVTID